MTAHPLSVLTDEDLDAVTGGMMQNDLDNGRLICEVGVAPVKPAEFLVFRIGQKTADSPE